MLELSDQFDLAFETLSCRVVCVLPGHQELDGHLAFRGPLQGLVDDALATPMQLSNDLVALD